MPNSAHETYEPLSQDEAELTRLLAEGKTPAEMAEALGRSVSWVHAQLRVLAARLQAG